MTTMTIGANKNSETRLCKTRMCKFFEQGSCSKGDKCCFAHSRSELQSQPNLHKTQLCMAFERNGTCRDGPACKYAHGQSELQANCKQDIASNLNKNAQLVYVPVRVQVVMINANTCGRLAAQVPRICLQPIPVICTPPLNTSSVNVPTPKDEMLMKHPKDDDDCSVQTTDEGLEIDLESFCSSSRQTSEWSTLSEDEPNDKAIIESGYNSECEIASDAMSEASHDFPILANQWMKASITQKVLKEVDASVRKTKMCNFFMQGCCTKGADCTFAHDNHSLKARPNLFRTSLCMAFERCGVCKLGDECKYAHGKDQLRKLPVSDIETKGSQVSTRSISDVSIVDEGITKDGSIQAQRTPAPLVHDATSIVVTVKNTFLHLRPQASVTRRRSASCHK